LKYREIRPGNPPFQKLFILLSAKRLSGSAGTFFPVIEALVQTESFNKRTLEAVTLYFLKTFL
jgi:hypothetical protein